MSTNTPTGATTPAAAETRSATGTRPGTDHRRRPGTTAIGRPDRWAAPTDEPPAGASSAAPLTFDPFCGRRLRNCVDAENAAFPGGH